MINILCRSIIAEPSKLNGHMRNRIQIRPPKKSKTVDINDSWSDVLEPVVKQIFSANNANDVRKLEFATLYDTCYKLVLQGHAKQLYKMVSESVQTYPKELGSRYRLSGSEILTNLVEIWTRFVNGMCLISDIFMYLDHEYAEGSGGVKLMDVATCYLRDELVIPTLSEIDARLVEQLSLYRRGAECDKQVIGLVFKILQSMSDPHSKSKLGDTAVNQKSTPGSLFDTVFVPEIIASMKNDYTVQIHNSDSLSSLQKMQIMEQWLVSEIELERVFFPPSYTGKLVSHLENEVLKPELSNLLENDAEVSAWIASDEFSLFEMATRLENRVCSTTLLKRLSQHFENDLLEINNSTNLTPVEYVEALFNLNKKYEEIANHVTPTETWKELKTTQERLLNNFPKVGNNLASYLDEYMKKNSDISLESTAEAIGKVMLMYDVITDKDDFAQASQRLLARRLINSSSRDKSLEIQWLNDLKAHDPSADVGKYLKMIEDIDESSAMFHGDKSIAPDSIPTKVNVLSKHLWPKSMQPQSTFDLQLPEDVRMAKEKFEDFYKAVRPDRMLLWNYNLSNTEVKMNINNSSYTLSVPMICMSVLNLFDGNQVLGINEISKRTGIPLGKELERHIKSLYLPRQANFLLKTPPGDDIADTDEFTFNNEFESPKKKIKVKLVSLKSSSEMKRMELIAEEREKKTEQAVIAAFRPQESLVHSVLIQRTAHAVSSHFKPSPHVIKSAIQSLLNRNVLKRNESDPNLYHLIA